MVGEVPSGRLVYDGRRLLSRDSPVLKGRQKLMYNGAVAVTLVLDEHGALDGEPEISTAGLYEPDEEDEDVAELETAIEDAIRRLGRRERRDDTAVEEAAGQAVRRAVNRLLGKKPMTMVHVIRLE